VSENFINIYSAIPQKERKTGEYYPEEKYM
jgi:hypothetical protein